MGGCEVVGGWERMSGWKRLGYRWIKGGGGGGLRWEDK